MTDLELHLPFGRFAGKSVREVLEHPNGKAYLKWLRGEQLQNEAKYKRLRMRFPEADAVVLRALKGLDLDP